jgi:CRP/FNR family cyclic AMP-dependent transcriptional regulator
VNAQVDNHHVDDDVDIAAALSRSYLFEDLTLDDLRPLAAVASIRRLKPGEPLCRIGDPADELYVVVRGELKDTVVNIDGDEIVHLIHGQGQTLGEPGFFSVDRNRIVQVSAVEPSVLVRLARRELTPFMERHPVVKDRALEGLAAATRWQTTMISSLTTRPLINRLVLQLLELAETNAAHDAGQLPRTPRISQSTLAAMVGVSRENVNRALAALTAKGSIRREGGRYVLTDEPGLRREASRDWLVASRRDKRARPDGAV